MKNILFTLVLIVVSSPAFATTFRVNNNPGVNAPYTTFAAAEAQAIAGDTILVEPSDTDYGGFTLTKRLTIIGNGFYLYQALLPQVNTESSRFTAFTVTGFASGSQLIGLVLNNVSIAGSDVVLTRCKINNSLDVLGSNHIVQGNYMNEPIIGIGGSNILLSNNLIDGGSLELYSFVAINVFIENNTFFQIVNGIDYIECNGVPVILRNNILINWQLEHSSNVIGHNNLSSEDAADGNIGPLTNGNQYLLSYTNLLAGGATDLGTTISDLQPGSSAVNAGYYGNGDDIGAFNDGTGRPTFIVNGIPPFPTVYSLNLGGPDGNNLPVTLGTRTNN